MHPPHPPLSPPSTSRQVPVGLQVDFLWAICAAAHNHSLCPTPHPTLQPDAASSRTFRLPPPIPVGDYTVTVTARHRLCAADCPAPATAHVRLRVREGLALSLRWVSPSGQGKYSGSEALLVESEAEGGPVASYFWTVTAVADPAKIYVQAPTGTSLRVPRGVVAGPARSTGARDVLDWPYTVGPRGGVPPPPCIASRGPTLPWVCRTKAERVVAKSVGGGHCRLQTPLKLALGVRGTVAGRRLGALEGAPPMHPLGRGYRPCWGAQRWGRLPSARCPGALVCGGRHAIPPPPSPCAGGRRGVGHIRPSGFAGALRAGVAVPPPLPPPLLRRDGHARRGTAVAPVMPCGIPPPQSFAEQLSVSGRGGGLTPTHPPFGSGFHCGKT